MIGYEQNYCFLIPFLFFFVPLQSKALLKAEIGSGKADIYIQRRLLQKYVT